MNTATPQTIVGIEPDGPMVRLALRAGETELAVHLDPRRAALIAARLNYAIAESVLAQEQCAGALTTAHGKMHYRDRREETQGSSREVAAFAIHKSAQKTLEARHASDR
ncbi:MAG: hypothetical protein BGO13_02535 [Burkholderiales bacterium 66-5]|nr:MAG: hypothetical protein BGO13_02535 [Burkholderiales bacterium 66-5]